MQVVDGLTRKLSGEGNIALTAFAFVDVLPKYSRSNVSI